MTPRISCLGSENTKRFLSTVREQIKTAQGQEKLYDDSRVIATDLIRCRRPIADLSSWRDAFKRVQVLVTTIELPVVTNSFGEAIQQSMLTAIRFETLSHMLSDQIQVLDLDLDLLNPSFEDSIFAKILGLLSGVKEMSLLELGTKLNYRPISLNPIILILGRESLVDWNEDQGEVRLSITQAGKRKIAVS